ncbi:MAG: hypothetical protein WAW39_07920 [Prosthecobacter sp.]|uniref:hypothetical protein n=1 Tax=Prosthecobacter sp. TaxID=1965333 RepID=UPI003BAE26BF
MHTPSQIRTRSRHLHAALETAWNSTADFQITFVSKIAAPSGSHKVPLVISELPLAA